MNSFPDIEKFEKKKTNTPMSALIKHKNEKKMTSRKESTHIRSKIIKTNNSNNTISKENSSKPIMEMEIQDLDDFFSNFIDLKLNQKNQTKPIENIQEEYQEILKDEDFDKKEFDFSKKMLRLKKKYPLPQFNDEQGANEGLNRIKDYTEMLNQANNINMASGVTHYLQQQREAQKELEKEQIAQNIYQSTIILQNKNEESLIKSPKNIDRKNRLKTIILKKNQDFKIRSTLKEFQRSSDKIDSFTRLEGLDHNNPESKKKQQEKIAQVHRTLFLNMIDSYEKELETIDKNIASSSKSKYIKEFTPPTSNNERSYLYMRTKSLYKPDRLTFVKKNGELAFSTNMMSLKAQVAKQKTVGFSDLVNFKMQSSSNLKNKDKRKEKSPSSRVKSRYHQVSFDYLKSVENTMF